MTEGPPDGGDGAPDQSQDPHAPAPPTPGQPVPHQTAPGLPLPPPYPGGYPPPAPPPPGTPPPGTPPPYNPPPYDAPPPGGSPYGQPPYGAPPYAQSPYGQSPYGAPPYGAPGWIANGPAGMSLADYGSRLGGWLIDFVILGIVGIIVNIPLHQLHSEHVVVRGTRTLRYHFGVGGIVIDAAVVILYGGLLCGSARGQTVGMMATRTRAVTADGGAPLGYPRAIGRAAFEYVMALLLFFPWVLDMLFPLWDARNQTLHDKVSGAVVVKI